MVSFIKNCIPSDFKLYPAALAIGPITGCLTALVLKKLDIHSGNYQNNKLKLSAVCLISTATAYYFAGVLAVAIVVAMVFDFMRRMKPINDALPDEEVSMPNQDEPVLIEETASPDEEVSVLNQESVPIGETTPPDEEVSVPNQESEPIKETSSPAVRADSTSPDSDVRRRAREAALKRNSNYDVLAIQAQERKKIEDEALARQKAEKERVALEQRVQQLAQKEAEAKAEEEAKEAELERAEQLINQTIPLNGEFPRHNEELNKMKKILQSRFDKIDAYDLTAPTCYQREILRVAIEKLEDKIKKMDKITTDLASLFLKSIINYIRMVGFNRM